MIDTACLDWNLWLTSYKLLNTLLNILASEGLAPLVVLRTKYRNTWQPKTPHTHTPLPGVNARTQM